MRKIGLVKLLSGALGGVLQLESLLSRARRETRAAVGSVWFVVTTAVIAIAAVSLTVVRSQLTSFQEMVLAALSAGGSVLLVLSFVWMHQLALAPLKQLRELREEVWRLTEAPLRPDAPMQAINACLAEAEGLLADVRLSSNGSDYREVVAAAGAWEARANAALRMLSEAAPGYVFPDKHDLSMLVKRSALESWLAEVVARMKLLAEADSRSQA